MGKAGSERQTIIESLKQRIARDPLSRAFLQLAEEYRREGRYKEAVEVCLEGLARHPTYHTARISLGRTYVEAGDLGNARRAFSDVLELQPENHLAGKLLAEVQKKMGNLAGAAETYRAILGQYPNDKEVESLLRQVLGGSSAPPPSPAAATPPASRVAPTSPVAPRPAAPAAVAGGPRTTIPRNAARVGPAPRPGDPSPDFHAGDLDVAGFSVAGEMVAAPDDPSAQPDAGDAAPESGDGDDALQTNTLGELYLRQGLVDRAIEVYRGMLRVDPGNQKAARRLSELLAAGADRHPAAPAGRHAPDDRPPPVPAPGALPTPTSGGPGPAAMTRPLPPSALSTAPPSAPARDQRIIRLERWLEGIRTAAVRESDPR